MEQKAFDKFMCYCEGNTDGMGKSVEAAGQRITELKSKLEADKAEKSQLDQELIQHKSDRASAKKDLETATAIREKEAADFAEETGSQKADLDAMTGAIAALDKGMGVVPPVAEGPREPRGEGGEGVADRGRLRARRDPWPPAGQEPVRRLQRSVGRDRWHPQGHEGRDGQGPRRRCLG
jgi:hypothetical protein